MGDCSSKKKTQQSAQLETPEKQKDEEIENFTGTVVKRINDEIPNIEVQTDLHEKTNLHTLMGSGWSVILSHPADFTPVCTTEFISICTLY